ncbi:MAG: FliO/MopB family protein [Alphaproteobacteria bacterium]|nr:FliO/MopB family protein [Alphaproteobacteria bacterium]
MAFEDYLRFVFALLFVLGLIAAAALVARRFGLTARGSPRGITGRRLAIVEVAPVDGKRRLVLVRRDDTEHLVLLGLTADTIIGKHQRGKRLLESLH